MNQLAYRSATVARPGRGWVGLAIKLLLVIAAGVVMGLQYHQPDKRILGALAAVLVFGVAWRLDMVSGLGLLVLTLPYPRGTTFGNTNFAFILLLLVIWLMRATHHAAPFPRKTMVDVPVIGLLIAYILSFYNIRFQHLQMGFANFLVFLACVALFYLIVNNVRSQAGLQRLHLFQSISVASVAVLGLYELYRPGAVVIPGWIGFATSEASRGLQLHDVRIGGPFFDFELMAEYAALMLVFVLFLWSRARSWAQRLVYGGLLLALALVLFATVTRGAMIALAAGGLYLAWLLRRSIRFVPLVIGAVTIVIALQALNYFTAHYTNAGDLLGRLLDPQSRRFVGGWMPEARAALWIDAFERMMIHPVIGHGPYYALQIGVKQYYWPHNGYLYLGNLLGFTGLAFYLLLLWKLLGLSRVSNPSLSDPSYARAFLVAGHVQLAIFMIDQMKIDYLRSPIYTFQIWLLIASIVAAAQIVRREQAGSLLSPP